MPKVDVDIRAVACEVINHLFVDAACIYQNFLYEYKAV
jgi:hypothetical protein